MRVAWDHCPVCQLKQKRLLPSHCPAYVATSVWAPCTTPPPATLALHQELHKPQLPCLPTTPPRLQFSKW